MPPIPKQINKVLISAYTGLGHFVLRTVLIRKIEELYPNCKIFIIAGNSFGTEFVLNDYPTLILNQKSNVFTKIIFFLKLRREKYDVIFLPIDASPKFLIRGSILAGIPIRVGHIFDDLTLPSYYYTIKVPVKINNSRNEIDMNLDLLEAVYKQKFQRDYQPFIQVTDDPKYLNQHGLKKNEYICLQMGGANGLPTTKRWFVENFIELINRLFFHFPSLHIIALGDIGDAVIVNKVCDSVKSNRLINISGKLNLEETKNLISTCRLLICHDSGLLHIGNALKKNVIVIYGPSDPDNYAVNLPSCHIIREKIPCSPCQGLFPGKFSFLTESESLRLCPVPECMKSVTVDSVYNRCVEVLNNSQTNSGVLN
jgi:heptosyltransferase-2